MLSISCEIERNIHGQKGSIAMLCLLMLCAAAIVTTALTVESVSRFSVTRKNIGHDCALCIAEAGADYAVSNLKSNSSYTGTGSPVSFGEGSFMVVVNTVSGRKIVASTGAIPGVASATVKVEVQAGAGQPMKFPDGAIVANGDVSMSGQADCITSPSNQHQASVRTNGNASFSGQANVDGTASANGTVTINGQANVYGGVQNSAPLITFPTRAEHDAWQSQLKAAAQAGTTKSGNVSGNQTWTSPVYVNGDLTVSSKAVLTITGGGIVYVKGKISFSGQSEIINSGQLVAEGKITQSGQAQYKTSGNINRVGLISFDESSGSSPAISITGQGATSPLGLVYSANGGIKISGQGDVNGALVAAGENGKGTVMISGQGDLYYPTNLLSNTEVTPPSSSFSVKSWLET